MTPIKMIVWRGVKVFSMDHADKLKLVCLAVNEEDAEWLVWSLGRAHNVEYRQLETDGQVAGL